LDRELYLPKEWAADRPRRQAADVPEEVAFATKPELARQMLARAFAAEVPATWVTGDTVYGNHRPLRRWLEERPQAYVLAVSSEEAVWVGWEQSRGKTLATQLPAEAWHRLSCGAGAKGPRLYDWAYQTTNSDSGPDWERGVLIRRSLSDPQELASYVVFAPSETPLETLVQVAGTRWAIERSLEESKGEVGLDQYEVRSWHGWYRHITLALLAHAFLSVMRAQGLTLSVPKGALRRELRDSLRRFKQQRGLCCL